MGLPRGLLDIANMSLDYLGQSAVNDLTSSSNGRLMGRHADHIRQTLLREYVWNWSKFRIVAQRTRTPAFDWKDAYALPPDFIRFLSTDGQSEQQQNEVYDLEISPTTGRMELLLNKSSQSTTVQTVNLRYVKDVPDPTVWDSKFRECMALKLATYVGFQITKDLALVKFLDERLDKELPAAISVDGQENLPVIIQNSKALSARVRGSLGGTGVAGPYTDFTTTYD